MRIIVDLDVLFTAVKASVLHMVVLLVLIVAVTPIEALETDIQVGDLVRVVPAVVFGLVVVLAEGLFVSCNRYLKYLI